MRISAKSEYACLALIELARSGVSGIPRRIRDIAQAQQIPERYLVQILLQLKTAGLVQSARGSEGGYQLTRDPGQIAVADVIAAIEGQGDTPRRSSSDSGRQLADLLDRARLAQWGILEKATIAELARAEAPHDWVL